FFCEHGENLDPIFGIFIRSIQPNLVKFERRCLLGTYTDSARLGLAKLLTIGFFDEFRGQRKCSALISPTYHLRSRPAIPPSPRATHLDFTLVIFPKVIEIISLNQLVCKLRK